MIVNSRSPAYCSSYEVKVANDAAFLAILPRIITIRGSKVTEFWTSALQRMGGILLGCCLSVSAWALSELDDHELSETTGAGIAIALDDFRFAMAPTSYIELTGTPTALANWKRGDVRYYGLTFSNGGGTGATWYGNSCSGDLSCPMGTAGVADFAPVVNPYVLRVFNYSGVDFQGATVSPTVFELLGPTASDDWRFAFWGEIRSDKLGPNDSTLQSQTIINGKPVTADGRGSVLRLMQVANTGDPTFGLVYESALSGDFRFSVAQTLASPDLPETVPAFDANEGLHFRNVDAYLPLGRLHHQAIVLDSAGTSGNFVIELTRLPNIANVYNDYYGDPTAAGYVRWGDFAAAEPTANDTTNGIYFVPPTAVGGPTINIGRSRVEGLQVQHLKITTLDAGP